MLLFAAICAHAQDRFTIQHFTNENGLPANGIKGIQLDRRTGFLWIGTQAGLARFDGKNFEYPNYEKRLTASSRIVFISKNREGDVLVEDDNFSVYRIHENQIQFVTTDTFLIPPAVVRGGGYAKQSAKQLADVLKRSERSLPLPHWITFHEEAGDSSSFSFIYFDHAYYYDATIDSLFDFPQFKGLVKLEGQVYYAKTDLTLWQYDETQMTLRQVPVDGIRPTSVQEDFGDLWVWEQGMQSPLLIYGKDLWKLVRAGTGLGVRPYCSGCVPLNAAITSIQDWEERGILFLGSEVSGLYMLRKPYLESLHSPDTTEAGTVEYAQAELQAGTVTTASGFTFSAEGKVVKALPRLRYPKSNIYKDKNGHFWYDLGDTICRYDPLEDRTFFIPMNDRSIKSVFAETEGHIYAISDVSIADLSGDHNQRLFELPLLPNALKNSLNPSTAVEWKPGVLAIAAEKLVLFDVKKKTLDTLNIPGLTVKVRTLLKYGHYLLIGTYGQGFYIYKDGVVKRMPNDKYGYLSFTHCFVPDSKGYCWISTNRGLFKVSFESLIAVFEKNLPGLYYHYFGKNDGIVNTELNGGCQPCALQLSNGRLSFPSMNGVILVDPATVQATPPSGLLFVDEVRADSSRYAWDSPELGKLPHSLKNLRVALSLPYYGNPENIYFSYKLEPYSNHWENQDLLQNNILQFGGLPPGNYTLHLRVRNGFGPEAYHITTLRFSIQKPWYQTLWFYALCLLLLLFLIIGLVRWRTARINRRRKELQHQVNVQTRNLIVQSTQLETQLRQLRKQQARLEEDNQIKARLIAIISHDLVTPLKFMVMVGRKLRSSFPTSDPAFGVADSMLTISQELEALSGNMLNWIKFHHENYTVQPEAFVLFDLVSEATEIAGTLAREKGLNFHNNVTEKLVIHQYRQALSVMIYNLAMNATKHTDRGSIRVEARILDSEVFIDISDTGSGMTQELTKQLRDGEALTNVATENKKHQFGFVIIRDLLKITGGRLELESEPGKGTRVTLRLPMLQNNAPTPS